MKEVHFCYNVPGQPTRYEAGKTYMEVTVACGMSPSRGGRYRKPRPCTLDRERVTCEKCKRHWLVA